MMSAKLIYTTIIAEVLVDIFWIYLGHCKVSNSLVPRLDFMTVSVSVLGVLILHSTLPTMTDFELKR